MTDKASPLVRLCAKKKKRPQEHSGMSAVSPETSPP